MARPVQTLNLSECAVKELERAAKDTSNGRVAVRAAMVLQKARGMSVRQIASALSERPSTVCKWVHRYQESGLAGLRNLPRGNSKGVYGDGFQQKLLELLNSTPPDDAPAWTYALLARQLQVSVPVVERYLRKSGIRLRDLKCSETGAENVRRILYGKTETADDRQEEAPAEDGASTQTGAAGSHSSDETPDPLQLEIVLRARNAEGEIVMERSALRDHAITDPGHFDISSVNGFRRDFAVYERNLFDAYVELAETFSAEYLQKAAVILKEDSPDVQLRTRRVCSEFGMFRILCAGELAGNANTDEIILTEGQEEVELLTCTEPGGSYRRTAEMLTRVQHRCSSGQINPRVLEGYVVRTGEKIQNALNNRADTVLRAAGFDPETLCPMEGCTLDIKSPDDGRKSGNDAKEEYDRLIAGIICRFNEGKPEYAQIRDSDLITKAGGDPDNVIIVRIDEVGVNRQNEQRAKTENGQKIRKGHKSTERVENTVIHIQRGDRSYVITATSMFRAFKLLLCFLLENGLKEGVRLLIFSDGASNIRKAVERYLGFYPYCLYLDWYHLQKRMREMVSSAFRGTRDQKRAILANVKVRLWAGNVDDTLDYLSGRDEKDIRNRKVFEEMKEYLDKRKRPFIYPYALRKELHAPNASSQAEKANDLIVAQRQKHNGMSWSYPGSGALAVVTALRLNGELQTWIQDREVPFAFQAAV